MKYVAANRLKSLEDRNFVTDPILQLFFTAFKERAKTYLGRNKIMIVMPAMAHILQNYISKESIRAQIMQLKLKEYDWVIYPVNNNKDPEDGNGGTHWSLLVYRKIDHKYLHFDPIHRLNRSHAIELMLNTLDSKSFDSDGFGPQFVDIACKKQENGYDCGPYVMMYLETIIENIRKGREADDDMFTPHEAGEIRKLL